MTQRQLFERRLELKVQELNLIQEEIHFIQEAIASMPSEATRAIASPYEPTMIDREDFFKSETDEVYLKCVTD